MLNAGQERLRCSFGLVTAPPSLSLVLDVPTGLDCRSVSSHTYLKKQVCFKLPPTWASILSNLKVFLSFFFLFFLANWTLIISSSSTAARLVGRPRVVANETFVRVRHTDTIAVDVSSYWPSRQQLCGGGGFLPANQDTQTHSNKSNNTWKKDVEGTCRSAASRRIIPSSGLLCTSSIFFFFFLRK